MAVSSKDRGYDMKDFIIGVFVAGVAASGVMYIQNQQVAEDCLDAQVFLRSISECMQSNKCIVGPSDIQEYYDANLTVAACSQGNNKDE